MKLNINRLSGGILLAFFSMIGLSGCSEDFPQSVESDKFVELKSIRIVNAGENGDQVLEGGINEAMKTITFPRLDTLTDFSAVRFEAETSEGAELENDVVQVPFESGDTQKDVILKVVNFPRFREYRAIIRFKVPVYGADFDQPVVYDYSTNPAGNPVYASFLTANTRGSGFDGEYVLVPERGGAGLHLLEVEKLKNNVTQPIPLNTTGMSGGTFTYNMAAQIHGHSYVASLSNPLKLYHWADPSAAPDVVANIDINTLSGVTHRHGDALSVNVDETGAGYAYFMSEGGPIIRVKITNFKDGSDVTVITPQINYGQWGHYNRIGNTDSYILSGHSQPMSLVNDGGTIAYTLKTTSLPRSTSDVRIFTFNGNRYLLGITVQRGAPNATDATLNLYDITKGSNIVDALTALEQTAVDGKVAPAVFSHTLAAAPNGSPGSQTGYHIIKDAEGKDEKLLIYGATSQGGFAIIEFGVAIEEED